MPVGPFVLDFAARREQLAIELDGDSHAGREEYDAHRTSYLERQGWKVIRFTNADIMCNPDGVAIMILNVLGGLRFSPRRGEGL